MLIFLMQIHIYRVLHGTFYRVCGRFTGGVTYTVFYKVFYRVFQMVVYEVYLGYVRDIV